MNLERLEQLARLEGVALAYEDVWGRTRRIDADVLVAVLGAMHVDAADDPAIDAAIERNAVEQARQVVPPACVAQAGSPASVPLRLRADDAAATLQWQLTEEEGRQHQGSVQLSELPEIDRTTIGSAAFVTRALALPADLPLGYHRLGVARDGVELGHSLLIVAPPRCHLPQSLQGQGRAWGAACQLYALRSARNWGIGDFTDLGTLAAQWGARGAALIGVNPLHAMFAHNPAHASPYSPSSRLFLNTLYLDVESVAEFTTCQAARERVQAAAFQQRLARLREAELVDYVEVAHVKREVLELLFEHFRGSHLAQRSERAQAFEAFRRERGDALRRFALFEALQESCHRDDPSCWGWQVWPTLLRDPDAPAAQQWAQQHEDRVTFFEYLQWLADEQLAAVARRCADAGLDIGLYVDLAVSVDRAGAECWGAQSLLAAGASIGAPPDAYNLKGQDWGLPPLVPRRLAQAAYAPFVETLRANMRHAGALRIDHVMALMRLYWIAEGDDPARGAYVHYPFDDLLAIVRLESVRNRCLVVGEDLGTVPPQVHEQLAASGVLSYRVLFFEHDAEGEFKLPAQFEPQALLVASTHDLPTLAGWWEGLDLDLRERLGLFPQPLQRQRQGVERVRDRERLLVALRRAALLPREVGVDPQATPALTDALGAAVQEYMARGPSKLVLAQLEDVVGAREQVNLPGTTDGHPNWRRKLALPLEAWPSDPRFTALTQRFAQVRGPAARALPGRAPTLQPVIPRATYRVQLHSGFTFADARALVPYLAALGISHLYCSPFLRARAGSRHGYDVVDHGQFNPEIGTRADFDALVAALRAHGMGMLIDLVPNHMGVLGGDNAWWLDVLENGRASAWADYFDIDWQSADPAVAGHVLLPLLGDQYGLVLERGELRLQFAADSGRFTLDYFEHRLPIDPACYGTLLRRAAARLRPREVSDEALRAFAGLIERFEQLPSRDSADGAAIRMRQRSKTLLKRELADLVGAQPALQRVIDERVAKLNGTVGSRVSFDALDALIDEQPYRLAHWRVASDQINYRRFFDINELAALRMERPEVFEATHALVLALAAEGAVDGMRIDHPDGLADPAAYFRRLQVRYAELAGLDLPDVPGQPLAARPLYVAIEKIVAAHEPVRADWEVHGTTGYRFANIVNGLFVEPSAKARLDRAWRAFVGDEAEEFDELSWRCRHAVMDGALAGELTVLASALLRLAREDRRTRDFTLNSLRRALADVVASFPVYRTYIVERPSAQDRRYVDWAIGRARRRSLAGDASVFDFLRRVLLGKPLPGAPVGLGERYGAFARRLQQYTSPVAAKGIEDTALYRHHRLISVNDVGGEPDDFGCSVAAFHATSRERAAHRPHAMLATSTHDAKRSEDVRARINVISEMPAAWRLTVRRWRRLNRSHKRTVDGATAPSRNDEYLLYQTLVGSLPAGSLGADELRAYGRRIEQAMLKSARESKAITSWINPNQAYEAALSAFVGALLDPRDGNLFLHDLQATVGVFAWYGALNSASMVAIKCLSPGVPDFYQGHAAIELTLMDPDNRGRVDHERRRALLARAEASLRLPDADARAADLRALLARAVDGEAKFRVTWAALQLRRAHEEMLQRAEHLPLPVHGPRAAHVVAFARRAGSRWIVVVATRLYASLGLDVGVAPTGAVWADTVVGWPVAGSGAALPDAPALTDRLSGRVHPVVASGLPLADVLCDFPLSLLVSGEAPA